MTLEISATVYIAVSLYLVGSQVFKTGLPVGHTYTGHEIGGNGARGSRGIFEFENPRKFGGVGINISKLSVRVLIVWEGKMCKGD